MLGPIYLSVPVYTSSGQKKCSPQKTGFFWRNSSLLHTVLGKKKIHNFGQTSNAQLPQLFSLFFWVNYTAMVPPNPHTKNHDHCSSYHTARDEQNLRVYHRQKCERPPCRSSNIARNKCNNKYFLWSARYMGVKLHEESKYFIRIFATRLYSSLFCCSSLCEKCKIACVHTKTNYHQSTPGPPE